MIEQNDDIDLNLEEARAKIEATRRLLEAQDGQLVQVIERLRRIEEGIAKVEGEIAACAVGAPGE